MTTRPSLRIFMLAWLAASLHNLAQAQESANTGLTPTQAVDQMVLPQGFHAELFASEPDIRQPVAAAFDERGRMWVVEYLQYPAPAGAKPVTVDQYLRTEYDKVPDPPPHGVKGADRIKILEDTNADGKADKVTTFVDGLNLASGVAVGYGGVFVANAPYLIFYPDKNRDDIPDGPPEVLLSGFGIQDAHAVINSLTWGPDGWLYGAQGSTCTAKVNGYEFQQGIWRYHPITKKFELFAEGGGNTWGVDFDRAGNLFGSSNGSFIAFHMVQGGYYWKGFAKHGPLHNPRTYGYFDAMPFNGQKPGGHVTPGGIVYKGGAFPKEYDGMFIGPNLLSNSVYWYNLHPKGSTFSLSLGGTLLDSKDRWFRPIDTLVGPDGCVYVVDWYDRRASHLDPRDNWDRTNGRVYRIVHGNRENVPPFDLAKWPTKDLLALRTHANAWWPDTALRILFERHDAAGVPNLLASLESESDPTSAMRDLWALDACGGLTPETSIQLLDHRLPQVRAWVIRRLADLGPPTDSAQHKLVNLAASEPDARVRSQLASSCQRWPSPIALPILNTLASRDADLADPYMPHLLWWALETHQRTNRAALDTLWLENRIRRPLVRDFLLERLARSSAASLQQPGGLSTCLSLLEHADSAESQHKVLQAFNEGLQGASPSKPTSELRSALERLPIDSPADQILLLRILVRLGSEQALATAIHNLTSSDTSDADKQILIDLFAELAPPQGFKPLFELYQTTANDGLKQAALSALRRFNRDEVGTILVAKLAPAAPGNDQLLRVLCSRKSWANQLLDAVEAGRLSVKDISAANALLIRQQGDQALNERLEKLWGKLPGAGTPEKDKRIAEVRGVLPEGDKGNPARGRQVFKEQCANCHRLFGEGAAIGPDLSGAERGDLDFLLTSIVDPSRQMRKEYQGVTVATKDGRVLTGLVLEQNDQYMVLFDSAQQKTTIPRSQIEETKDATNSVMPEGIVDKLRDDQVRDLFRYLQSSGP